MTEITQRELQNALDENRQITEEEIREWKQLKKYLSNKIKESPPIFRIHELNELLKICDAAIEKLNKKNNPN